MKQFLHFKKVYLLNFCVVAIAGCSGSLCVDKNIFESYEFCKINTWCIIRMRDFAIKESNLILIRL